MAGTLTANSTIVTSILSSVLPPIVVKAASLALDQWDICFNIHREIMYLKSTLNEVNEILEEAEERQIDNINVREMLRDLVDIGYEARDELDDFITSVSTISTRRTSRSVMLNCLPISFFLSCFDNCWSSSVQNETSGAFALRCRVACNIRNIRNRLGDIMKQRDIVDISQYVREREKGSESVPKFVRTESSSLPDNQSDLLVGREDVKEDIMKKLLDKNNNHVQLVTIWGMVGVGKTTLAQAIYNDDRVKGYRSENKRWFPVGGKLNCKEIISKILNRSDTHSIDVMQTQVVEKFKGERFVIVLDDVWEVDSSEWKLLWNPMTHVENGGMIIITTRIGNVTSASNSQVQHNLLPLSYEDCWRIFESHAFVGGNSDNKPDLKCIGKKIVVKLKGLPLAAEVVGRSLFNEPNEKIWEDFLHAREWKLRKKDDDVMPALRWSYKLLPPHLKHCFAYCALFPKGHEFDEKVMVEMWMAHDLIHNMGGEDGQRRPEDIGATYFKELANASLFQCVDGKHIMHDMIHDLALLVSNEEFAIANGLLSTDQMERVRHMTIIHNNDYSKNLCFPKSKRILTLYTVNVNIWSFILQNILDNTHSYKDILEDAFKHLKSIRVLVLVSHKITDIPDNISELKHLRYLDVSKTSVKRFPDSLCHLYHLQMIAVPLNAELPRDIVNMVNLRHVRANLSTCKGVGKLTSLQELSSIHVSKDDNIRELGDMQRLRGKLRIKGLENIEKLEDDVGALMEKQTLMDELELEFDQHLEESTISAQVLDTLVCPPNLTYLKIVGYTGLELPRLMGDRKLVVKLQTLELSDCPKLESLPPLGELASLKHLSLWRVGVKRLGDGFNGKFTKSKVFFPSLESLRFYKMQEWEEWGYIIIKNSNMSFFPRLTSLEIQSCAKLELVLPVVKNCTSKGTREDKHSIMNAANFMTSLSRLKICNCDGLKRLQLDALVSLKELTISNCKSLVQITSGMCLATTIERLEISQCQHLETMDFERLPSLKLNSVPCLIGIKILNLCLCESLRSLNIDIHGLDSLENLRIVDCPVLDLTFEEGSSSSSTENSAAVPLHICIDNTQIFRKLFQHKFVFLESLTIERLKGFENFGDTEANNFCKLRSLKSLCILGCKDLKSLPADFYKLSSLNNLKIKNCAKLQSLPDLGLPLSIESLFISNCPLLYGRCKDESGADLEKIKYIREVTVTEEEALINQICPIL